MELEIINKLFLELSQVATAETARELAYKKALEQIRDHREITDGKPTARAMQDFAREALKRAQYR